MGIHCFSSKYLITVVVYKPCFSAYNYTYQHSAEIPTVVENANDYKHGYVPRLIKWRVFGMAKQCDPSLTVLGHLKQPVTQSRSPVATSVSQGVAGRQQPHTKVNCKPRFSAKTSAQIIFIKNKLAPYGTDGRLLTTDVSAKYQKSDPIKFKYCAIV